jgi:hypothetical protein
LLLFLIVSILLSIPSIQTELGKKATSYLQKEYNVAINVDKVDLSFLGKVQLKNIYIKNHHEDSLIFAKKLTTSILSLRKMLNNNMEFGTISLINFKLFIKTYKGEVDDALSIFVDKFDDGQPSDKPSGFLLTAKKLHFKNGFVSVYDENVDEKPLDFKNVSGNSTNFVIQGPNVSTTIIDLSFIENHDLLITSLASNFSYTKKQMKFKNTVVKTKTSKIIGDIEFNYKREDFSDFNNKVNLIALIKKADLSMVDLKHFYNELGTKDVLHFTTEISGQLNNFTAKNLKLNSNENAIINGTLLLKNSFNQENGFSLKGNLTNLTSDYYHLKSLLPNILGNKLPSSFKKLGRFNLAGSTYITNNIIDANVIINSQLGKAAAKLKLTNIDNMDNASYKGNVKFFNFNLGELLNKSSVKMISMNADVDGFGFTLDKINSSVNGIISKIDYNNYTYKNISINGIVKNQHFNGNMEVNDNNIKLNFKGLADLSNNIYQFNFKSIIDYCNLKAINIYTKDSIANVTGEIKINVKGNTIDDLVGEINFNNFLYINPKDNYFFKDFNITSSFQDSIRTIKINSSEIVNGRIKGKFKFNELPKLIRNSIGSIYTNYKPFKISSDQNIDFNFKIYNKIVEIFYPNVQLSANTTIKGKIVSNNNLFRLTVKSPKIIAFNNEVKNVKVQLDNKNPIFNTQVLIDNINAKYYNIKHFKLLNITLNDTLFFKTEFNEGTKYNEKFSLSFYHTINAQSKSVFGVKKSNFTYKNKKWFINASSNLENKIVYNFKSQKTIIKPFDITSKNQKITFSGKITDSISKNINFDFKNVQLANVTPKLDSLNLEGLINGHINYSQIEKQVRPTANIEISNFYINKSEQGNLKVNVKGENSLTKYNVNVSLNHNNENTLSAIGNIDFTPKKPTIVLNLNFERFKLNAFSPLGEDVFTNFRGFVYGSAQFSGLLENPVMNGELYLDKAGMYFPYLNVDYDFDGTSIITLKNQTFNFEDVTLKDKAHQTTGRLTGTLSHYNFDKWKLNLNINTKNLLVLNTKEKENSLYYGSGFLSGNASIHGFTDKLVIDVQGKTNKGTYFIIPISDVKTVDNVQLIRFVNKNKSEDDTKKRNEFISEKLKGLSLNFDLEVTKDAVVEMVLDKATRSYLKGSGTGNLQINLDTKDKFDMYGDFIVDNGVYNFKYGGFINKPFTVKKGGSVSWNGNPYTAEINIEAIYRVSANPKSLLENISTNRKIPIDLITRFSGELFNSKRSFDIEIPNSSSTVASELAFKLNNNDENIKTLHFVSLLASGAFYNENNFSVNTSGFAYGTATNLLSDAFDNIFNQADNKFKLKPVYTVGEKNTVDNLNIDDQLALALDYQVNDRILINGKVGVPIGSKKQSNVIGEVNIEFLLNQEGTLRSSIFNRQNEIQYTDEEEGYTQGIGLNYQINFNTGKELLEKLGIKRKTIKDTISPKKELDTLAIKRKLINFKNKINKNE